MPTGYHHVTLNVTDLERARAFYEGILRFTVDQDFPGEKLRFRFGEGNQPACSASAMTRSVPRWSASATPTTFSGSSSSSGDFGSR
jgi:catechol 2,3-dioxygenase-like lactoylglutathione lyase family enzyme